jgi:hypothetical protein
LFVLSAGKASAGNWTTPCGGQNGELLAARINTCDAMVLGEWLAQKAPGQDDRYQLLNGRILWGNPKAVAYVAAASKAMQARAAARHGVQSAACLKSTDSGWVTVDVFDLDSDDHRGCHADFYKGWHDFFVEAPNVSSAARATVLARQVIGYSIRQGQVGQVLQYVTFKLRGAKPLGGEMSDLLFEAIEKRALNTRDADDFLRNCDWGTEPVDSVMKRWRLRVLKSSNERARCWSLMGLQSAYGQRNVPFVPLGCFSADESKSVIDHWTTVVCADVGCN